MDQEATRAGELVGLFRDDPDRQLLAGQIGSGQFERFGGFRFVDVDNRGLGLVTSRLQFLQRILRDVVALGAPRGVVIGSHLVSPPSNLAAVLCTSVERVHQIIRARIDTRSTVIYITLSSMPPQGRSDGAFRVLSWSRKSQR